ncbi:MAG: hydantoin utilization protein B [Alphaproteobacteria bacterium]|nr:MAG: hydantoin utilization protein B [Alphaproteobacteria bacterium]
MSNASALPVDLLTMVVLQNGVKTAGADMTETLVRSARSGVLNTAYDFSCTFVTRDFSTVSTTGGGLPFHLNSIDLVPRALAAKFGEDMAEGDVFACNSSYMGNTHCADLTLVSPVFAGGLMVGYACARAHLADIGFPTPTTYDRPCKDYYAEGLTLPGVRIQRGRQDVREVIEICMANIRSPDVFYGDYLAMIASLRVGEARIGALCNKYGANTFLAFAEEFGRYGERMAREAIGRLPSGTVHKELLYDPLPELGYPEGFPVRATVTVDAGEERVVVDLTANEDNIPMGINTSEAFMLACVRQAVFATLGPEVPRVTGAFSRVEIRAREGAAVGIPKFPASTSVGAVGLGQVLYNTVSLALTELGEEVYALSGTNVGTATSSSVVSGYDSRSGRTYVNQLVLGHWGGPALRGHDGWLTFGSASSAGFLGQTSVEIAERQQPIVIEAQRPRVDSGGAGEFEGAPGSEVIIAVRRDPVRFISNQGGRIFPPQGARGGHSGGACWSWIIEADGTRRELALDADFVLKPGQKVLSHSCGGGGWGDPRRRAPERVLKRLEDGLLSPVKAVEVYGVVVEEGAGARRYAIDSAATAARRATMIA